MKEKILILEDEIGIRSFVSINLKREGYEVIEAGCGQEAIDKIKNEKNIIYISCIYNVCNDRITSFCRQCSRSFEFL